MKLRKPARYDRRSYRRSQPQSCLRWRRSVQSLFLGLVAVLTLLMIIPSSVPSAWGQTPSSLPETIPPQFRQIERSLPLINEILTRQSSKINQDEIWLDGRKLFTIAVPQEANSSDTSGTVSNSARASIIEDRLWRIVHRGFEAGSLDVKAQIDEKSRQPIIYASYRANGTDYQDEILTVTDLDARVNGSDLGSWGDDLSQIIEEALLTSQQERQPDNLQRQALIAAGILFGIAIGSTILSSLQRRLRVEHKVLSAQSKNDSEQLSSASNSGEAPEITSALLQRRVANQGKRGVIEVKRRLLQFGQILVWGSGLFLILGLFPHSRWLQPLIVGWLKIPIRILVIGLITYIAIRISAVLIDRLFWAIQNGTGFAASTSQRLLLRFTTFSTVAKSIAVLICGGIGVLTAIATLGIEISPALLASAGIIGVGISLASQNLIKDIINGFLILLEDQYGVGDVIQVGDVSGLVENMNLRITQLRNEEGRLITIPNSSIAIVQNLSMEWSRVDLSISVAYNADLERALAVIEQVAQHMSQDSHWKDLILEPPILLGVDKLDYVGATIRLWIKTQPLKQWEVAREYRRRLKRAFDEAGVEIGVPQQALSFNRANDMDHQIPIRIERPPVSR